MARGIKGKISRRFILFTCSSLVSTLLDQAIAWTLFDVLRKPFANSDYARILVSSVIARVCSVALNYAINSRLVFQDRQAGASEGEIEQEESEGGIPTKRSLPRFIATAALVLFLSSLGVFFLHTEFGIHEGIAKICCDLALFFLNYALQRVWVFADGR